MNYTLNGLPGTSIDNLVYLRKEKAVHSFIEPVVTCFLLKRCDSFIVIFSKTNTLTPFDNLLTHFHLLYKFIVPNNAYLKFFNVTFLKSSNIAEPDFTSLIVGCQIQHYRNT